MGSITFLPVFLQYARGASATVSGLRTLPVVAGLLVTAIISLGLSCAQWNGR
jgi:hypothetical protein